MSALFTAAEVQRSLDREPPEVIAELLREYLARHYPEVVVTATLADALQSSTAWALDIFVPGRPAAQGSKRHVGGGRLVEQSKAVAPWRTSVAWHAAQEFRGAPLDGPLQIVVEFVMPRPASCPKRSTPPAIKRPDADKMLRAVFDSLTGVIWRDDSQVVDVHARKRIAEIDEQPGARIRVGRQG